MTTTEIKAVLLAQECYEWAIKSGECKCFGEITCDYCLDVSKARKIIKRLTGVEAEKICMS